MISDQTFNFIKDKEGCRLTAYKDQGGVLTIGYGHTGKDVLPGLIITQEQADALLQKDVAVFQAGMLAMIHVTLNENQITALTSFAYNVGLHNLASSTLLKKINANDFNGASKEFTKWDHVDGNIDEGLLNRRLAEQSLFLKK